MFAVVCVPNFALQALLRNELELYARPVALIDAAGTNLAKTLVLECTRAAELSDVTPGLTAPQAQARCRELILKPRSLSAEQSATEILLQTAYAFSPNIENTAPGVCTIDLRGLNFSSTDRAGCPEPAANHDASTLSQRGEDTAPHLKSGEQQSFEFVQNTELVSSTQSAKPNKALLMNWSHQIIAALQRLGLHAQLGIASTPSIALLGARAANPMLMVEHIKQFFASLPIAALEPTTQVLDILKRWGVHTAGAFLALGKDAIAARLGAEALELFHRASADTIRPLNIVLPTDTFEEQMEFEVLIETIEPLLFVLRRFVEQLSTRIALTYRVIAEFELTLRLESGAPYQHTFKIPAPTASVETLFRMLHTHLENLRTDAPIISLRLRATPTRAETQQFGLFESALRDPNHFHETLARLTALLGADRVGTPVVQPSHHPDVFRMETPNFAKSSLLNPPPEHRNACSLCLRRFRPAIHADVELNNGEPAFISSLRVNARITKKPRGPWHTSGTWWDQRRWTRQEWDVETSDGSVYRLFHANDNWNIEGIYD